LRDNGETEGNNGKIYVLVSHDVTTNVTPIRSSGREVVIQTIKWEENEVICGFFDAL